MKNELTNVNIGLNVLNDEYILEEIKTIEECQRALDIEYRRKEYYENKGVVLVEENKGFELTSLQVVDIINNFRKEEGNKVELQHKSFLASIDTELESLKKCKISQQNILPSTYINSRGKEYRCYKMNKAGVMQMLNKESATVRYKTQLYIEALEKKNEELSTPSCMISDIRARLKAYERELDRHDYKQCLERINTLEQLKVNLTLSHSDKTYTTTELAKELNFTSAKALNKELEERKIQYKVNGTWVLSSKYSDKGYVESKQKILDSGHIIYFTKWTEEGRRWIIDLLSND